MVAVMNSKLWAKNSENVEQEFQDRGDKKESMKHDGVLLMTAGQCLYVPEGWWVLTYGLPHNRPSNVEAAQIAEAKKASRRGQKITGKQKCGRHFCSMMWLPVWSKGVQQDVNVVSRLYAELTLAQRYLTKGIVGDASWKKKMECLRDQAALMSAEDGTGTAPVRVLEKKNSESD